MGLLRSFVMPRVEVMNLGRGGEQGSRKEKERWRKKEADSLSIRAGEMSSLPGRDTYSIRSGTTLRYRQSEAW